MGAQRPAQLGTQKPAHNGRTGACLEWAHKRPVPNGRTEACPDWEHRNLPIMGAQKPA